MTPQRRGTRKWFNLCAIIAAFAVGFYLITPSSKPQQGFVYKGKTYTLSNVQDNDVKLMPEQKQQVRKALDGCHLEFRWHRLTVSPDYVCND